jgi:hypothetical protein
MGEEGYGGVMQFDLGPTLRVLVGGMAPQYTKQRGRTACWARCTVALAGCGFSLAS